MNLEFLNIGWTWFANDHIVFLFDTTSQLHWNWVRPQNTFGTFRDWCSTCTCKVCFLCIPLRWDIQKYNCWQQCLNNYLVNLEAEITSAYLQGCYKNLFQRVLFFFVVDISTLFFFFMLFLYFLGNYFSSSVRVLLWRKESNLAADYTLFQLWLFLKCCVNEIDWSLYCTCITEHPPLTYRKESG